MILVWGREPRFRPEGSGRTFGVIPDEMALMFTVALPLDLSMVIRNDGSQPWQH